MQGTRYSSQTIVIQSKRVCPALNAKEQLHTHNINAQQIQEWACLYPICQEGNDLWRHQGMEVKTILLLSHFALNHYNKDPFIYSQQQYLQLIHKNHTQTVPMSRRRRQNNQSEESKQAEEAEEVRNVDEEHNLSEMSDEEEGEDLQENEEGDYARIDELDHYEDEGVDNQEVEQDLQARRRADDELNQRDQRENRGRRRENDDIEDYIEEEADDYLERLQERRHQMMILEEDEEIEGDYDNIVKAEEVKGKLAEWIENPEVVKFIKKKFIAFLKNYQDATTGKFVYDEALQEMCTSNKQSFVVSYEHLKTFSMTLAVWVAFEPLLLIPILNDISYSLATKYFPSFRNIHAEVFVKFYDIPLQDRIRELRHQHLNKLIKVRGVVTKRSPVFSQLKELWCYCFRCNEPKGPFQVVHPNDLKYINKGACRSCQSMGPFPTNKQKTIYRNHQKITVQESPSEVDAGRIPRQKQVVLLGDNIDVARPGDEVEISGIYITKYCQKLNATQGFPIFSTMIEANNIQRTKEGPNKDDIISQDNIRRMAFDPKFKTKLLNSLAPSIYGHEDIKLALALSLFGGNEKIVEETHRIRGDINVLVLGDPGTAKSQFLKNILKVFPRAVYATGKGASAVGLTASVKRDFVTGEWSLEAGALVLADKGLCLIDEFDKMNENDRTSIHEAMEQQSISISKAGIVTTLRARCAVIAAANPIKGRYDSQISFKENVDLTDPILSRFDILCVVKDQVDERIDHDLSTFVINSHMENHMIPIKDAPLTQNRVEGEAFKLEEVQAYIRYAREKCIPQINPEHNEMIKQFYTKLRQEAQHTGGINIAVRHIESIIRMTTAHARMHLRASTTKEDAEVAIAVMCRSFIQTQKYSSQNLLKKKFGNYLRALDYYWGGAW